MKYWKKFKVLFLFAPIFRRVMESKGWKVTKTGVSGLTIKYRCSTYDIDLYNS